jgi:hypothetical protein
MRELGGSMPSPSCYKLHSGCHRPYTEEMTRRQGDGHLSHIRDQVEEMGFHPGKVSTRWKVLGRDSPGESGPGPRVLCWQVRWLPPVTPATWEVLGGGSEFRQASKASRPYLKNT